jgi:hypothetical protein
VIALVAFRHEDEADTLYLKELPRTEQFGDRKFPSPSAYYEAVAAETASSDSSERARHYAEAQRDWHMRGQTGCQFARLVAKDAEVMGWDYAVYDGNPQQVTPEIVVRLEDQVVDAIKRPETQVLSFLMPEVTEARDAVQIMRLLTVNSAFWLERDEMTSDGQALYLRYPVKDTQAWVMAFAPFDFLPNTRRGPLFELAIRVKEKPDWLYHRLNQDRGLAHLADVPLQMSGKYWDDRFDSTLRRTRRILGGEPDQVSAAKATLVVPTGRLVA